MRRVLCFSCLSMVIACSSSDDAPDTAPCRNATERCFGEIEVPLDRSGGREGQITVGYVLEPARSGRTQETIVYLEGGPGAAATGGIDDIVELLGPLLDDHNLLIVDYRGVGRSTPLYCPGLPDPMYPNPIFRPTEEQVVACQQRIEPRGGAFFGTAAAMDDVEDVRTALGLAPLKLLGSSYGVFAAEVFLSRHPASVRSIVFHAGPLASEPGTTIDWDPRFAETTMRGLDSLCTHARCGLESASDAWRQFVAAIRRGDAPELDVADAIRLHRFASEGGPSLEDLLDAVVAWNGGNVTPAAEMARFYESIFADPPAAPRENDLAVASNALFLHVACADFAMPFEGTSDLPTRRAHLEAALRTLPVEAYDPFTREEWWTVEPVVDTACVAYTLDAQPAISREPVPTDVPILFVHPEIDTTVADVPTILASYPHAQILDIRLGTHAGAFESACAREEVRRFLRRETIDRASCPASLSGPAQDPAER